MAIRLRTNSIHCVTIPAQRAAELREHYRAAMFDDVMPWWMEHSLDRENGGYYSHLERDGTPFTTMARCTFG